MLTYITTLVVSNGEEHLLMNYKGKTIAPIQTELAPTSLRHSPLRPPSHLNNVAPC